MDPQLTADDLLTLRTLVEEALHGVHPAGWVPDHEYAVKLAALNVKLRMLSNKAERAGGT